MTESTFLNNTDVMYSSMQELKQYGFMLSMDDFGTGYSSLSYIQMLPFTMLKLDRSFIIKMEQDAVVQEIVKSVIHIANTKQINTIAEGVEEPSQAKLLRELGCGQVQGYLYGKPMPAKEAEAFMRENMKHKVTY